MKLKIFYLLVVIVVALSCWLIEGWMWGFRGGWLDLARLVLLVGGCLLVGAGLAFAARRLGGGIWIAAGLLVLLGLCLPAYTFTAIFPASGPEPFGSPEALTLFSLAGLALIVAALLFYSALKVNQARPVKGEAGTGVSTSPNNQKYTGLGAILLGVLLIAKALHSEYWLLVWDLTTDPLGTIWVVFPVFAAIFAALILSVLLAGRLKLLGLGFTLLVVGLLIAVASRAGQVDFRRLTEERAGQVSQALERYHARYGRYPQSLSQLRPWYALSLPRPVIIFGQDWCYDAGEDFYRLGYVDRLHWSDPDLFGHSYQMVGRAPALPELCADEIEALRSRFTT